MDRNFERAPVFYSLGPLCGGGGKRCILSGRSLGEGEYFLRLVYSIVSFVISIPNDMIISLLKVKFKNRMSECIIQRLLHSRHLPQLDCLHRMSYNVVSPDFQFRISAFVVWTGFICISAVMFYFSVLLLSTVCSFCSYFGCYFGLFMTLVLFLYFNLFFVFWI